MRIVIQRVTGASVAIHGETHASINTGLLILVGVCHSDTTEDADWLAGKVAGMRIFNDTDGKMNLSVNEIKGEILAISQFTLYAETKKGNRPSFIQAARPETAIPLYEHFVNQLSARTGIQVKTGVFGADMKVSLLNDGPVTIIMDSQNKDLF